MSQLRVGMVSFAHSTHPERYLASLLANENVDLVGVWDSEPERARRHADPAGVEFYDDLTALLKAVDAVVICSEYDQHADHVERALAEGLAVLCEKPLGQSREAVARIEAAVAASPALFMVALPCRYIPGMVRARELVMSGAIGEVVSVNGTNRGACPGTWFVDPARSGGGAIMDHTAHMADLMQWVTGAQIETVFAVAGRNLLAIGVEDSAFLQLRLAGGIIGTLDASWSRREPLPSTFDVTLSVVGTEGELFVDALAQRVSVYASGVEWSPYAGSIDDAMVDAFVAAVRTRDASPIPLTAGVSATLASFAAYDSIVEQAPVSVSRA